MTGKIALITGGALGIGRATALAFAREGAGVVIADRLPDEMEKTVPTSGRSGARNITGGQITH